MRRAERRLAGAAAAVAMAMTARGTGAPAIEGRLRPPSGTTVSVFAADLKDARFLRFTPKGDLLVTLPRSGRVVRLEPDGDADGLSDGREDLLSGLNRPHGLDLHEGWLYVAETDAVGRVRFDPATGKASGPFERVVKGLPGGGNHWTRTIRFGPDGLLYVSIGSTCNVCLEKDRRRAAIVRYQPDGSGEEIFATGLRNAVGFDWRPADGQIYATDNGRDLLGDDFPPCELDRVVQGGFYGWPIANGNRVPDPDFGKGQEARISASIPPVHGFRPHNAPLGITFLRGEGVPAAYRGAAVVALHGSWNRTRKDGYKVVSLHWGSDGRIDERDFLTGFLGASDDDVSGRPVDVAEGPDGSVYVSDDHAGSIYRVQWQVTGPMPRGPLAPTTRSGAASPKEAAPVSRAAVARGRALWDSNGCAACHDPKAKAPGMVTKPLAGLSKRYDAASLAAYLKTPQPPMPAYDLKDAQRADLAAFLLAQHP
ncbi:MAG TPA: PQQ-dependent sugar dehydrogenase [Vicinamibacteria bacterium]|nr:PQQ-dependent sugar dehydrogenase [Vicinamibacteria bacterium]